jgi:peptidyl-prolyl cis-trans isomerase B (cyclophilin B)
MQSTNPAFILNILFILLSINMSESQTITHIQIETPLGTMKGILYNETPLHRDNFTKLVNERFYDSLLFHRVIEGFMIQGGDPESKHATAGAPLGMGGPGYQVPAEFKDSLVHIKGAIAAARNNNPEKKSSGSQFYIVAGRPVTIAELGAQEARHIGFKYTEQSKKDYQDLGGVPFLDQDYTVFGRITDGLDIIDKISKASADGRNRPVENIWMKVSIIQ